VLVKWSRVRLVLSILTCEGLFATMRERIQYAPRAAVDTPKNDKDGLSLIGIPRYYDYGGAVHVHSTYSDGLGTIPEIAQAANDAGLDFVVMCDHSSLQASHDGLDGWQGKTLVLIGTEITTTVGHLLAMGVPSTFDTTASQDAVLVQKNILAAGGFGYIALPCDLKDHWRDFDQREKAIGLEVFNFSAIARTKINLPTLAMIWRRYHGSRPLRAFHLVASRPERELKLWDKLCQPETPGAPMRPVIGIGSLDAHAVMRFGGREYPFPTYTEVFRTLRTHVVTSSALSYGETVGYNSTDSASDMDLVHGALRSGHCYISYDNFGDPTGFVFEAFWNGRRGKFTTDDDNRALMGDVVTLKTGVESSAENLTLSVRAPRTRTIVRLFRNGQLICATRGGRLEYVVKQPGVYRAEVFLYTRRIRNLCFGAKPWVFSNPIYVQSSSVYSGNDSLEATPLSSERGMTQL